jgi:hypothetical protein
VVKIALAPCNQSGLLSQLARNFDPLVNTASGTGRTAQLEQPCNPNEFRVTRCSLYEPVELSKGQKSESRSAAENFGFSNQRFIVMDERNKGIKHTWKNPFHPTTIQTQVPSAYSTSRPTSTNKKLAFQAQTCILKHSSSSQVPLHPPARYGSIPPFSYLLISPTPPPQ